MGFADFYFERQNEFHIKIDNNPEKDLKYIVVIPCYYEFEIISTLNSIWNSKRPKSSAEVIIVINSSEDSEKKILDQNKKTYSEVKNWIAMHDDSSLRFFVINEESLSRKFAGAGLARKIGMDQAIYRFNKLNHDRGIIISLDADAVIEKNYFTELEKHFNQSSRTLPEVKQDCFAVPGAGWAVDLSLYAR